MTLQAVLQQPTTIDRRAALSLQGSRWTAPPRFLMIVQFWRALPSEAMHEILGMRDQNVNSFYRVPVDSPQRFLVDVQFSAGANYDPFSLDPLQPHVLPVLPRNPLHSGTLYQPGTPLAKMCFGCFATC